MARNKYIYALAEWSLVVSSGVNEGGTWAGAMEALRSGRIPVFVRLHGEVPEGNRRLAEMGALPFPEEPWTDLAARLEVAAHARKGVRADLPAPSRPRIQRAMPRTGQLTLVTERPLEITIPEPVPAPEVLPESTPDEALAPASAAQEAFEPPQTAALPLNIFDAVWPLLVAHLQEPRTLQELARALEVRPAQLQDWLDRGIQEGKVCKKARPVRYVVQFSLFHECGENRTSTAQG